MAHDIIYYMIPDMGHYIIPDMAHYMIPDMGHNMIPDKAHYIAHDTFPPYTPIWLPPVVICDGAPSAIKTGAKSK